MNAHILAATLALTCSLVPVIVQSAESPTPDTVLQSKEAEVLRLRELLKTREDELERLRHENTRLRQEAAHPPENQPVTPPPAMPAQPATSPPAPSKPLLQLGEPSTDTPLEASDLVAWFSSDPALAASKLGNRTFLVRGVAARFETATLQRRFWVDFEAPSQGLRLRALVVYPVGWTAVFATRDGSGLIERGQTANRTVLQRGDTMLLRARCQGLKGNELRFDRGEWVPNTNP